jgi:hypothetical protein
MNISNTSTNKPSSSLRKALVRNKRQSKEAIEEAALRWFASNVIVLNEKIDRKQVKRLLKAVEKFEEIFGAYRTKIPAIGGQLDQAENALQQVLTGQSGVRSAGYLLQQLNYLHGLYSGFFSRDLPLLLRAKMFGPAREQPDVRIDQVRSASQVDSIDLGAIQDAVHNALQPTKEEAGLLKKVYRGTCFPKIDYKSIAQQLMTLSYQELEELTTMGKTPLVSTEPAPEETPGTEVPTTEGLARGAGRSVLLEKFDAEQARELARVVSGIQRNIDTAVPELATIATAVGSLESQARNEITSGKWIKGNSVKQLLMFYNLLTKVKGQWPTIRGMFSKGTEIGPEQIGQLQKALSGAGADSFLTKLGNALSTNHFPGLDPATFADQVSAAAQRPEGLEAVEKLFSGLGSLPPVSATGEPETTASATTGTAETTGTEGTEGTEETKETEETTGTADKAMVPSDKAKLNTLLKSLSQKGFRPQSKNPDEQMAELMALLKQSGLVAG